MDNPINWINIIKTECPTFKCKNIFLEHITIKSHLQNWVDIEEEYYMQLKNTINYGITQPYSIKDLNNDFEKVKQALADYLNQELHKKEITEFNLNRVISNFNIADFSTKGSSVLRKEFCPTNENEIEDYNKKFDGYLQDMQQGYFRHYNIGYPKEILLLNFNYTDLPKKLIQYIRTNNWRLEDCVKKTPIKIISIHGELNNNNNPIIFGYGDDQDEAHKEFEKRGGEYLNNVKTINYLKTPNYKNLLNFMESGMYQIFIMGHSCGLSDKTLLNTMFEHENCISIKPFFYEWINEENEKQNNYDDIVKNIYRIFTNKSMMREKVVNKEYCELFSTEK
ncbi:MAG: bacteriophage abortive infection AbiH family protein [Prevotellaceae bacterium]|jgi:hypothetical protein|nr:bacteriophage abortive infection AbiH family protein [Prevotellaceae bacterium]